MPLFSLYGLLAARARGVLDTDSDSDFDLDETVALRAEGCSGLCSETLKLRNTGRGAAPQVEGEELGVSVGEDDAEAEVATSGGFAVGVAVGGAGGAGSVEPGAATCDAEQAFGWCDGVGDGVAGELAGGAVEAPFQDVTMEVVESPWVGLAGADGLG